MSNQYEWTTNIEPIVGVPMYDYDVSTDLPDEFHPRDSYTVKLLDKAASVIKNFLHAELDKLTDPTDDQIAEIEAILDKVLEDLKQLFFNTSDDDDSYDLDKYKVLYKKINSYHDVASDKTSDTADVNDADLAEYDAQFNTLPRPFVANYIYDDEFFAYWRLAGNNPLAIKGVTSIPSKFPITDEQYQNIMGEDDSLSDALSQKRIFMLDYENLSGAVAEGGVTKSESDTSDEQVIGYSYMAIAMFAVDKNTGKFLPVAIQCGQSSSDNNPLFFPSDEEELRWGWQRAKMVVNAADKAEHQLSRHLGITHLVSEVFSLATMRNFESEHPLYKLLISHTEGTNRVNHNAIVALLKPRKFIDSLIAGELSDTAQKTVDTRLSFDFYENFLPTDLENRKVTDTSAIVDYPYRDDALLLWDAIYEWVYAYVHLVYPAELQLNSDQSLQAWMQDIVDNGKITGFKIVRTRKEFAEVLTMVIFTGSVQHAAVNYPQHDYMMYSPAMIGTLAAPKPTSTSGNSKSDWLDMLPTTNRAGLKITLYTVLSGVYNGYLGEYVDTKGNELFSEENDPEIYKELTNFREKLTAIEDTITQRNETRYHSYETLLPSAVPASVNI